MRATLDESVDMGYIYLQDKISPGESKKTLHIERDGIELVIDIAKDGHILGIEVFNAKKLFPQELLESAEKL